MPCRAGRIFVCARPLRGSLRTFESGKERIMLAALRAWWSGSAVPTAVEMQDLLGKIERLRKKFPTDTAKATPHDAPLLRVIDDDLKDIKTGAKVGADGKVDANQWNALSEADRRQLATRADQLFDDLQGL